MQFTMSLSGLLLLELLLVLSTFAARADEAGRAKNRRVERVKLN